MDTNPRFTIKPARTGLAINALRSAFAALLVAGALYSHDSSAVLVLANGTYEIEWYVGEQAPSIDLAPDQFVVLACGAELVWVYATFPTIATRTIEVAGTKRWGATRSAAITGTPTENTCVLWRGDNARFIADNLQITGN